MRPSEEHAAGPAQRRTGSHEPYAVAVVYPKNVAQMYEPEGARDAEAYPRLLDLTGESLHRWNMNH